MFITSIVVTILAAVGQYFLGYPRFHPLQADPHQHGESRRVGIWITTLGILKAAGALGLLIVSACLRLESPPPAAWFFFYRCHHHSLARTRPLVWSGDRVPSLGNRRAGVASGFNLKNPI
jgi:hypothetical protein